MEKTSNLLTRLLLLLPLLLIANGKLRAQSDSLSNYNVVFDYQDAWYVYDEGYDSYIPYIAERHFDIPAHVIFCNLEQNRGYSILIKCEKEDNFLFIEGALKQKLPANKILSLSVDSLYRAYQKRQIYITIFGSREVKSKWVGVGFNKKFQKVTDKASSDTFQIKPRRVMAYKSSLSLLFFLVFGVFAYLSIANARVFSGFYNLRGVITTYSREQSLFANQALSRANVLFIILLSLILALLYIVLQSRGINVFGKRWFLQDGETTGVLLSNFFRLSIVFFVGFIVKYFFLGLLGRLFNVTKVIDLHFFKLLQSTLLFYSVFTLFVLILTVNYIPWEVILRETLIYILIAFYFARVIIIFLTINRTLPIQLLYLISYLCIVEILPTIIGLRILV